MRVRLTAAVMAGAGALTFGMMAYAADPPQSADGTITRGDAEARAKSEFTALDTDQDGYLSGAELAEMMPMMRHGDGGPPDPPRPPADMQGAAPPPPPPAPPPPGGGMAAMVMRAGDTNGDGKISPAEFSAMALKRFDMADTNHDGKLSMAERGAARQAMRDHMQARGGMGDRDMNDQDTRDHDMNGPAGDDDR